MLRKIVIIFSVLALSSCGRLDWSQFAGQIGKSPSRSVDKRVNVARFTSEGYAAYDGNVTSVDVGVHEDVKGGTTTCSLISPRTGTRAASRGWSPMDMYTNRSPEDEIQGREGEPNIFFEGDDNDRNGGQDSFLQTIVPPSMLMNSFDFAQKETQKDQFNVWIRFERTGILFENLFRARTFAGSNGCDAILTVCADSLDVDNQSCRGSFKQLKQVIVVVDKLGGARDKIFKPKSDRARHDIAEVRGVLVSLDGEGRPVGQDEETILAKK